MKKPVKPSRKVIQFAERLERSIDRQFGQSLAPVPLNQRRKPDRTPPPNSAA